MIITEKNVLIAKFMGYTDGSDFQYLTHPKSGFDSDIDLLPYHSDWNWLAEVVDKIEAFEDENRFTKYNFEVVQSFVEITDVHTSETIVELDRNTKIEAVFDACVEFITWYNQQN